MPLNRRFFLKALGAASLTSTLKPATTLAETKQIVKLQFTAKPYLQNFTNEKVCIASTFNKPAFAWVEIFDQNNTLLKTIYQVEDGMRNANSDLFKFTVPHENKNFKYRIVAKEVLKFEAYKIEYGPTIYSKIIETQLPISTDDVTHLLILNDVHEYTQTYSELYQMSTLPRKDLVLLNGDSFHYVTKGEDIVNKLIQPVAESFGSKTPFMVIRGNHETRGAFARDFKKFFDFPEDKFYQSFQLGSIFVIILDGGEDKPDTHEVYGGTVDYDQYRLEQKVWLEKIFASKAYKKSKHRIVINHIPWFHSDDWHGTLHNRSCFHDLVQKNRVDAVISGHTHEYGFYPPNEDHNYHMIIGGGPKVGQRTFVELTADSKKLTIQLKKDDGSVVDTLNKI